MEVKILQLIEGAKQARGLTVVIDVFRAFSVETYIMNNNVDTIIPVADIDMARRLKEEIPNSVLIGERHGVKIEGFDYGNSPTDVSKIDFTGKTIIHTTSAGTQGIANAVNADEIITGSLVNAKAISKYILAKNPDRVSLVCMGLEGQRPIDEDTLCAEYIKSLLENKPLQNLDARIENLKLSSGAKFFDESLKEVFPQTDFTLSTSVNKFNFVLKVEKGDDGLNRVRKINL